MDSRANYPAGGSSSCARGRSGRLPDLSFERDGSVLCVATRGPWACITVTRDDGARALDILLSRDDASTLADWMMEHSDGQSLGSRYGDPGPARKPETADESD